MFFTEQANSDSVPDIHVRKRVDSIVAAKSKKKKKGARSSMKNSTSNIEMKEGISEISGGTDKHHDDQGMSAFSKSAVISEHKYADSPPYTDQKLRSSGETLPLGSGRDDQKEISYEEEEESNSGNKDNKHQDMVDCEPSIEAGDESTGPKNIIDFNVKSRTDIDGLEENEKSAKNNSNEHKKEVKIDIEMDTGLAINRNNEIPEADDRQEEEDENSLGNNDENLNHYAKSIDTDQGLYKTQQTQDKSSNFPANICQMMEKKSPRNGNTGSGNYYTLKDEVSIGSHDIESGHKEYPPVDIVTPTSKSPTQETYFTKSTERKLVCPPDKRTSSEKKLKKKSKSDKHKSSKSHNGALKLHRSKLDESPETHELEKHNEENEEKVLYIERRYCTVCGLEQPLRAKHCKDCERCIAQYDHHCPWLGTCIGERNHLMFYWFLVFQLIEIAWGEFELFDYMFTRDYEHWASENVVRIVLTVFLSFFLIMVLSLLCFHTYLAIVNQTTWECLSWYKISYLREWHEDWGSPFSEGAWKNVKFFCCTSKEQLKKWEMPKYRPDLEENKPKSSLSEVDS